MTKQRKASAKSSPKAQAPEAATSKAKPLSKLARLEGMLRRPDGATIPQLVKALDWQAHSVRGAMSGALKKKQGLKVTSTKAEGKDRVYKIAG